MPTRAHAKSRVAFLSNISAQTTCIKHRTKNNQPRIHGKLKTLRNKAIPAPDLKKEGNQTPA